MMHSNPRILAKHVCFGAFTVGLLCVAACAGERSRLPTEFRAGRVLHQQKISHTFGPGGINHTFTIYELPEAVRATIADRGLPYLNSLPSAAIQRKRWKPRKIDGYTVRDGKKVPTFAPWWEPFSVWHSTPIPKEKRWLRYGRGAEKEWSPTLDNFYGMHVGDVSIRSFTSQISPEFVGLFDDAIGSPGSFYSYGGYRGQCVVVVAPAQGSLFYLFRD